MNNLFSKYTKQLFLLFLISVFSSCKKFVEADLPRTSVSSSQLFTSDQGAISAVAGLYSQMSQLNLLMTNGGATIYAGLSADELYNTSPNASYDAFRSNSLSSSESILQSRFWNSSYKTIYQANAILEGLQSSTSLSLATKNQLRGEMLFVRAFHYFYLVNFFGDVPYLTSTDYRINATSPRTLVATIYSFIVTDLKEAQSLLLDSYPANSKGRPNKWTVTMMLARVYLYQKDWSNSELQATAILNSGLYSLSASLSTAFLASSPEVIFQLQRDNNNTAEGFTLVPSSATARPLLSIAPNLINAFESGDNRKTAWLQKNVVGGQNYYFPYKYKLRTRTPINEYLTVFRLAEIYLIRAEARANQNNLSGAQDDINAIRNRAGLQNISLTDLPSVLAAIEHERQTELFVEWGHRWFDLKRTGRADAVLSIAKGSYWQSTDQLYPIPLSELQKNPFLTQNPGY
jgi:starch-binding outer membrane protein, SusD/RagB family